MPRSTIISVFEGAVDTIRFIGPLIVTFLPVRSTPEKTEASLFLPHPKSNNINILKIILERKTAEREARTLLINVIRNLLTPPV
jgi:hypothetical protein